MSTEAKKPKPKKPRSTCMRCGGPLQGGYNVSFCSLECRDYEPSPQDIRAAAAAIRATWSQDEEMRRRRRIPGDLQQGLG